MSKYSSITQHNQLPMRADDFMAPQQEKEPLFSWRRACYLLSFLLSSLVVVIFLYTSNPRLRQIDGFGEYPHQSPLHDELRHFLSQFGNVSADNELVDGLTSAECLSIFPDLYYEVDRAVAYWKQNNHIISEEDVRLDPGRRGAMRILIHENELRILESATALEVGYRAMGLLTILERSLDSATEAGEKLPTIEAAISIYDTADPEEGRTTSLWTTARDLRVDSNERLWLIPNFDFWYSPPSGSFEDAKRLAMQYDNASFAEKIPKIVWRGNSNMNPELRGALVTTTKDKSWADVISMPSGNPDDRLEEFQYCRYAMTLYTEGISFSGRLKFLMNCPSLLVVHDAEWSVHYDHLLKSEGPDQNCVRVRRDWLDLEEKVQWYLNHPAEADRIIANSLKTFRSRYTTRAATSCYFRKLIQGYASVSFTPQALYPLYEGEVLAPRGLSWAKFMMWPHDGVFDYMDFVGE